MRLKRLAPAAFQMGYERKVIQIYYIRSGQKRNPAIIERNFHPSMFVSANIQIFDFLRAVFALGNGNSAAVETISRVSHS